MTPRSGGEESVDEGMLVAVRNLLLDAQLPPDAVAMPGGEGEERAATAASASEEPGDPSWIAWSDAAVESMWAAAELAIDWVAASRMGSPSR
jgi:hypothetical protein